MLSGQVHMPIISSAREATVATHAWTKLHAQIMSWVSGIYKCNLCMAHINHSCEQHIVKGQ